MQLYAGSSTQFVRDTVQNQIAGKLKNAFFRNYRFQPSPGEVVSWQNSLRAVCDVFEAARLTDHGVLLEYRLPLTSKRLDCMVCGEGTDRDDHAVIVELKQWSKCEESGGESLVTTWVGGGLRDVLHPSVQVRQYQRYLEDAHTAFYEPPEPIRLNSCAYLHNYYPQADDHLFARKFAGVLEEAPSFTADDAGRLAQYLTRRLARGRGMRVLDRVQHSRYRPSKKLMDHVGHLIKGAPAYVLLDEQLVVYEKVLQAARAGFHDRRKSVLLIRGGPGTGKSVIALNLMGDLLLGEYNTHYATGSRAFTQTLRRIIGARGEVQFKYFNSYRDVEPNEIDVLVCDEAHRIRKFSHDRFTPKKNRTNRPQVEELIDASKVAVFFIDDRQIVRPSEIGSSALIRATADRFECRLQEFELEAQFRCAGSDGFLNWIDNTLGITRTANVLWDGSEGFDFRIFDSPAALEEAIRLKAAAGFSARLTAGFCWPWSKPKPDGTLVDDVRIGEYRRPWNAKSDAGRLAPGIPREALWAHDPDGIDQIGCVYTAQGFEFDYAGVIVGTDLCYEPDAGEWIGRPEESHDTVVRRSKQQFVDLVKHVYRVLLSRGLKGCYVYFIDKETERFVRSRVESFGEVETTEVGASAGEADAAGMREGAGADAADLETAGGAGGLVPPFRILEPAEVRPFENCVPLYSLDIAAGRFSEEQSVEEVAAQMIPGPEDAIWVELPSAFRPARDLFVARVAGESMNRRIPNGAWCLFRLDPSGTRQGKVVIAAHREIQDLDTGGHYTIKVYESEKQVLPDGTWRHTRIILRPDTNAEGYEPIVLEAEPAGEVTIIAEWLAVVG